MKSSWPTPTKDPCPTFSSSKCTLEGFHNCKNSFSGAIANRPRFLRHCATISTYRKSRRPPRHNTPRGCFGGRKKRNVREKKLDYAKESDCQLRVVKNRLLGPE